MLHIATDAGLFKLHAEQTQSKLPPLATTLGFAEVSVLVGGAGCCLADCVADGGDITPPSDGFTPALLSPSRKRISVMG